MGTCKEGSGARFKDKGMAKVTQCSQHARQRVRHWFVCV